VLACFNDGDCATKTRTLFFLESQLREQAKKIAVRNFDDSTNRQKHSYEEEGFFS